MKFLETSFSKTFLSYGTGLTVVMQFLTWNRIWRCIHRFEYGHSTIFHFSKRKLIIFLSIWCICICMQAALQLTSKDLLTGMNIFNHNCFVNLLTVSMLSFHYFCTIGESEKEQQFSYNCVPSLRQLQELWLKWHQFLLEHLKQAKKTTHRHTQKVCLEDELGN